MSDMKTPMNEEALRRLPKVALHDHLDGSLRVETVIELAREIEYRGLPTTDLDELTDWFHQDKPTNSLETYLQAFGHTIAVLQEPEALRRAIFESVEDLQRDGVVHGEVRFAPELLTRRSMSLAQVFDVAQDAFADASSRHGITVNMIACAMRNADESRRIAEEVIQRKGSNVVGFDLAGPERGWPASRHREALDLLRREGVPYTLHAGEGDGVSSILDAISCGASRIGHGVRVADDIAVDGVMYSLGRDAEMVRAAGVLLEVCPSSNLHTQMYPDLASHPVDVLLRAGFSVAINTDNRLMSRTSISGEWHALADTFGWGVSEFLSTTVAAARSAFIDQTERDRVLAEVVLPGFRT
jgi:adenosine deaminase